MKKSELKSIIREAILGLKENSPQPSRPSRPHETPTIDPDVAPSRAPRRRTLTPPDDSPTTAPKAENVKSLTSKITDRFIDLKK